MAHRAHLFSLKIAHGLRTSLSDTPYNSKVFFKDAMAGIAIGIIAIPLAMALAIASGVAPQYGLYTAIIAGFVIPLTGGSRFSVSGPTAAFVVILYPVVQQYGLPGLLVASILAGIILVVMALLRLGRYIEYIPEPVTLGFTGGIAVVIAVLQLKDFLGLHIADMPIHFTDKVLALISALPDFSVWSLITGLATLLVMLLWPLLKTPVPGHLPAVIVGSLVAVTLNQQGAGIATVGSTFSFVLPDGTVFHQYYRIFNGPGKELSRAKHRWYSVGPSPRICCRRLLPSRCSRPLSRCCVPWYWIAHPVPSTAPTVNCWGRVSAILLRPFSVVLQPQLRLPVRLPISRLVQ